MEELSGRRKIPDTSWRRGNDSGVIGTYGSPHSSYSSNGTPPESASPGKSTSSASSPRSACDFILEIENFIPVGCLRIERYKCQITTEVWTSCTEWYWLGHPREIIAPKAGPFLQNVLQEVLFNTLPIAPYRNLHQAGWIRLEFKMRDVEWGQVRVYILPEDIGQRLIERNEAALKRSMQRLLAEIDTSKATWNAKWSQDTRVTHIGTDLSETELSLFYLYNTLPSPSPDSSLVHNPYAKEAMDRILEGKVKGLKTTMLAYQRRSAAMMLEKEAQPSQLVDPRFRKVTDQDESTWYCDITNGTCLRIPRMYEAARGGICAETMGLGKTLICLALILATRELSSEIPAEYSLGTIPVRKRVGSLLDMTAATIGRTGTPWKGYIDELEEDGCDYSQCKAAIQRSAGHYYIPTPVPLRATRNPIYMPPRKIYLTTATLVVVPANLVRQWEREIEKHTTGLNVLVMGGSQASLPPAERLAEYDIILFSKQRFDRESKDGTDDEGRRPSPGRQQLFQSDKVYHSPLRDLHFKRLITDEGHTMGNAKTMTKNNAIIVVDSLQLTSRWIVSGTPTQGLYGANSATAVGKSNSLAFSETGSVAASPLSVSDDMLAAPNAEQERKDLEKLGNIATTYLKARPWANAKSGQDFAAWSQYVMQPRHSSRSHGDQDCLRKTLEGMIIRHRPADIEKDLVLPPLHQKIVYLEGSLQDKISLNLFSLVITSNAVLSERKDVDYLFHHRQRRALGELVSNLRQASFFWCGFTKTDVENTIQLAKDFLAKGKMHTSEEDRSLLQKVFECGDVALLNPIWLTASKHHEMPFYVQNDWASSIRNAWALDKKDVNPTLFGSTQLLALQKFVRTRLAKNQAIDGLEDAGNAARAAALAASSSSPLSRSKTSKIQKKIDESPTLAGGIRVVEDVSPRKRRKSSASIYGAHSIESSERQDTSLGDSFTPITPIKLQMSDDSKVGQINFPKKEHVADLPSITTISNVSELQSTSVKILSTASSKLSYLIDQIAMYQEAEKIIVFYETDNVAYYIAQALEAINVEHLIYAKSLSSDRRSRYIVTFNQLPRFRVLLMEISQAAFGLDVSSASRVYFVNPVLNKQVEAQAVKRAHRIGQFRPVYIETLVLRDSIEEVIIERRKVMSNDEQQKCKTVLDDETLYDWIKNVRFVGLPREDLPGPQQMTSLETPQPLFARSKPTDGAVSDPDAGLIDLTPSPPSKRRGKRNATAAMIDTANFTDVVETENDNRIVFRTPAKQRQKMVTFAVEDDTESLEANNTPAMAATSIETLRQLNTTPYPCGLRPSSPSSEEFLSAQSSREGSPASKAERSRLDTQSARTLLSRFRTGGKSLSPTPPSPGVGPSSGSMSRLS